MVNLRLEGKGGGGLVCHQQHARTSKYSLLLQVVLPGAASLAVGERALVILFTSVYPGMAGQVTTGSEDSIAGGADVFLLGNGVLDDGDYLLRLQVGVAHDVGGGIGRWTVVVVVVATNIAMRIVSMRVIFRRGFTRH